MRMNVLQRSGRRVIPALLAICVAACGASAARGAQNDPLVTFTLSGSWHADSHSTVPASQEAGREWEEQATFDVVFRNTVGGPLHLSDLLAANAGSPDWLATGYFTKVIATAKVIDTRGDCVGPIPVGKSFALDVDKVEGTTLVVSIDLLSAIYGNEGRCPAANEVSGLTFSDADPTPEGGWPKWQPELPGVFTNLSVEAGTRITTMYFKIDLANHDKTHQSQTQEFSFTYSNQSPPKGVHTAYVYYEGTATIAW